MQRFSKVLDFVTLKAVAVKRQDTMPRLGIPSRKQPRHQIVSRTYKTMTVQAVNRRVYSSEFQRACTRSLNSVNFSNTKYTE
ncbi:hypothetical protein BgiBS90_003669 [Biomphalaria glabrata]|nr:hypothetical protein BgiBS90_003669 [Biomphalaria glabrata]